MTEHAAVVFVFFFLAEYGSIVLMCILTSILFLGGYLLMNNLDLFNYIHFILSNLGFVD
jgi:NADH-ubiquinone oxidoreductase chain 1